MKKELKFVFAALTLLTGLTACNSNDDGVTEGIEIPGITITNDAECCSAEEALQVYKFLQTLKIVPELSIEVVGKFLYLMPLVIMSQYDRIFFLFQLQDFFFQLLVVHREKICFKDAKLHKKNENI